LDCNNSLIKGGGREGEGVAKQHQIKPLIGKGRNKQCWIIDSLMD